MTSDQAPVQPRTPAAAPDQPAPQPPVATPCKDGIFHASNIGGIDRSPDAATVRDRIVTFDVEKVETLPARLDLNLFDDVCVVAVRRPDAVAGPVPVWTGSIEGVPGSQVTIVFNPGAVAGSVVMPPRAFNLEMVRDGVYRIREVDVTRYPNEQPPMTPPGAPGAGTPTAPPGAGSPAAPPPPPGGPPTATAPPAPPTTKPPPPKKKQP
jgi:hypothetical protein